MENGPPKNGLPQFLSGKLSACNEGNTEDTSTILGQEDSWRWERILTPVFLPGELHGPRNLVDCSP